MLAVHAQTPVVSEAQPVSNTKVGGSVSHRKTQLRDFGARWVPWAYESASCVNSWAAIGAPLIEDGSGAATWTLGLPVRGAAYRFWPRAGRSGGSALFLHEKRSCAQGRVHEGNERDR